MSSKSFSDFHKETIDWFKKEYGEGILNEPKVVNFENSKSAEYIKSIESDLDLSKKELYKIVKQEYLKHQEIMSDTKQKEVYLDFEGAMEILRSRGRKVSIKETAKEIGYSEPGLMHVRKKAPKSVAMVFKYLKDNMLTFEDLVKEREA